ncbi:MAG: DUF177 domain-containing protein [Pyrinomonadaceae bacterium MAG19_C2-C3]|nr:DUF177 domain-containing protein [Pyrinomonadaceae bacterium MAG19_C2-C3]
MTVIEIDNLTQTPKAFAARFEPLEFDFDDDDGLTLTSPAEVAGEASLKNGELRLRGTVKAEAEVLCDRCLTGVPKSVHQMFDAVFVPASEDTRHPSIELAADDLSKGIYESNVFDLSELAREQLLLSIDTRTLCREECKGLCPTCGVDLNRTACECKQDDVDPRWAALAQLKNNLDKS